MVGNGEGATGPSGMTVEVLSMTTLRSSSPGGGAEDMRRGAVRVSERIAIAN